KRQAEGAKNAAGVHERSGQIPAFPRRVTEPLNGTSSTDNSARGIPLPLRKKVAARGRAFGFSASGFSAAFVSDLGEWASCPYWVGTRGSGEGPSSGPDELCATENAREPVAFF